MKRSIKTTLAAVALILTAGSAWAYPVEVKDTVTMFGADNIEYNGNYRVFSEDEKTYLFGTFCVEKSQTFGSGKQYTVASIEEYADYDTDYLDYATKWLYSKYLSLFFANESGLDLAMQNAIWKIEGEVSSVSGLAQDLYDQAIEAQDAQQREVLAYDVKVMNLTSLSSTGQTVYNQSQLIAQPVPEPSTLLLLGGGIAGLALARRRASKK